MPVGPARLRRTPHQNHTFVVFVSGSPLVLKKFQNRVPKETPQITKNHAKSSKVLSKVLSGGYLLQALKKQQQIDDFGVPETLKT